MTAPNVFSPEYTQHFVDAIRAFKRDYKSTAKAQGRACHASHRLAFVQAHLASQGLESDWFTERIVKRYCGADGWAALLEALRMRLRSRFPSLQRNSGNKRAKIGRSIT